LAKRSAGQPPEPDGLAHIIIFKVPPVLGAVVVTVVVAEGCVVLVVVVCVDAGVVVVLAQPINIEALAISTTKITRNFFIYSPSFALFY
jgi:hypothetical protein